MKIQEARAIARRVSRLVIGVFAVCALMPPNLVALPSVMLTQMPGTFSSPVHIANAGDGSGRLFVVEQAGTIRVYKNGALLPTPFLDITGLVTCCGEEGLLSVAFHPDYGSNGYFYVYYINRLASPGDITVARYHVSANPDVADPASAQIVLVVPHPVNSNHNGGQLFFSPTDGYLYMGTGDGGGGGDGPNNAQNLTVMLGKMLRLDVNGTGAVPCGQSAAMPYAIPASNPFAGDATDCKEIWAYGVRNPWRFSFDRVTGDLFIGDVGQDLYEEIDFQAATSTGGENYGWHKMEGFHCYNPSTDCNDGSLTLPILEHAHASGWCAINGGFRYRGAAISSLYGYYVYSDTCLGDLYASADAGGGNWTDALLLASSHSVSSFGEDEAGELYIADLGGKIYRIDQAPFPVPSVSSLSPASVIAGDPDFVLTVNGTGFVPESVVRVNGADRPTTFVSALQLTANVPASDIAAAGGASILVFTKSPGGGASNSKTLDINPTFLDVSLGYWAYSFIEAVYNADVTAGCGGRLYCPEKPATRAQMAVFLLMASQGPAYVPPACTPGSPIFLDVPCPTGFAVRFVEDLANRGITAGCQVGEYCPADPITRAQMAVLLLATSQGSSYVPPACTPGSPIFSDVPCPGGFAVDFIEDLYHRKIAAGCGSGKFCPNDPVTRAEMAVFLTSTFALPLP